MHVMREKRQRPTRRLRYWWALVITALLLLVLGGGVVWLFSQPAEPAPSAKKAPDHNIAARRSSRRVAKKRSVTSADSVASATPPLTSRFTNDIYTTPTLTLRLTGAKIVTDKTNHPALFIQYELANDGSTLITPAAIWRQYAILRQGQANAKKSDITPLTEATLTDKDAQGDLGKQVKASQTPLAPTKKMSGAMVYTFVNKDPIRLQFIDRDTGRPLGTKTYEITG